MPRWPIPTISTPGGGRSRAQSQFPLPAGTPCDRCLTRPARERHHRDDDPTNNAEENIERLCNRCHQRAHGKLTPEWARRVGAPGADAKRARTHCPAGHPLAGDNLSIKPNGTRRCKACHAASTARYKARLRLTRTARGPLENPATPGPW